MNLNRLNIISILLCSSYYHVSHFYLVVALMPLWDCCIGVGWKNMVMVEVFMGWTLTNIDLIVAAAFFIDLSVILVDLVGSCGFKLGCTS